MPDTQAACRSLQPQTTILRAAGGMSRTIDLRRPVKLDASQQHKVEQHPEVSRLRSKWKSQKPKTRQRDLDRREYRKVRRRHERGLLKRIIENHNKTQPIADIQRQLQGLSTAVGEEDDAAARQVIEYPFAERFEASRTLFTITTSSKDEESQRRVAAIHALAALCKRQERQRVRRQSSDSQDARHATLDCSERNLPLDLPILCEPTQCIFCLGDESFETRVREKPFASRGDLKKHFLCMHLQHYPKDQAIECPYPQCDLLLDNQLHLRNHAERVHGTPT